MDIEAQLAVRPGTDLDSQITEREMLVRIQPMS